MVKINVNVALLKIQMQMYALQKHFDVHLLHKNELHSPLYLLFSLLLMERPLYHIAHRARIEMSLIDIQCAHKSVIFYLTHYSLFHIFELLLA